MSLSLLTSLLVLGQICFFIYLIILDTTNCDFFFFNLDGYHIFLYSSKYSCALFWNAVTWKWVIWGLALLRYIRSRAVFTVGLTSLYIWDRYSFTVSCKLWGFWFWLARTGTVCGALNLDPFGWFFLQLWGVSSRACADQYPAESSEELRDLSEVLPPCSSLLSGPGSWTPVVLVSLGSSSLTQGAHLDLPPWPCSMNALKAVSWGNSRVHLIWSLSLKDHFSLSHDIWRLKHHFDFLFGFWLFPMDVEAHRGS